MTNILRFACIIAVVAAGIASPAFAQGANTVAPQHNRSKVTVRQSGVNSFAMVPGTVGGTAAYTPQYIPGFGNVGASCGSC
jgi:hypothetical protein